MRHRFYAEVSQSPDHYYLTRFQYRDNTHGTYALMVQSRAKQTVWQNQHE